ncbi:MAG: T9SS type A sorting domain-containing protein [Fibrobacter sp.]|nr:T9SS type A sorting domain-containing protein [Fibrobacter sp.]
MRIFTISVILVMITFQSGYSAVTGPCDIYATGQAPAVAAYSTVRLLSSKYTGPLYQVRRTSDNQTKDIFALPSGIANAAAQDSFLGNGAGTISKIYDQSGKNNHLVKAPKGCYQCPNGTACKDDIEADAKARPVTIAGRKAYALLTKPQVGYRNNNTTDMPEGLTGQGIYMVADGKKYGTACCFDFGNASKDNCYGPTGIMAALYFGTGFWGKGAGNGPWFQADLEGGVWSGGSGASGVKNQNLPSSPMEYAFGILHVNVVDNQSHYAIKVGNAQSGSLTTAYDGKAPKQLRLQGGIILGIGGDNSNSSSGTFFEGVITKGRPTSDIDDKVLKNVQAAGYGSNIVKSVYEQAPNRSSGNSMFNVLCKSGAVDAVISYTLNHTSHVRVNVFNQQGKMVAAIVNNAMPAGEQSSVWNAAGVPKGVYIAHLEIDGRSQGSGKIIIK